MMKLGKIFIFAPKIDIFESKLGNGKSSICKMKLKNEIGETQLEVQNDFPMRNSYLGHFNLKYSPFSFKISSFPPKMTLFLSW
jgi:hypothetical protein